MRGSGPSTVFPWGSSPTHLQIRLTIALEATARDHLLGEPFTRPIQNPTRTPAWSTSSRSRPASFLHRCTDPAPRGNGHLRLKVRPDEHPSVSRHHLAGIRPANSGASSTAAMSMAEATPPYTKSVDIQSFDRGISLR